MKIDSIDILERAADALDLSPRASHPMRADRLLVRDTDVIHVVKVRDIEWIEASGNYIDIHANGRSHLLRATLKGITGRLPANRFVKIHRSLIVNSLMVRELRRDPEGHCWLVMASGENLRAQQPVHEIKGVIMTVSSA